MILKNDGKYLPFIIKFGIVELSNIVISYLIYSFLLYFNVHYIIASIIAFFISVLNSFFWNNKYVLKIQLTKSVILLTLGKTYVSYAFTGLALQNVLLFILVERIGVSKYFAPLFISVITIPFSFILNKLWAFRNFTFIVTQLADDKKYINKHE